MKKRFVTSPFKRHLESIENSSDFLNFVDNTFAHSHTDYHDLISRRKFMSLMSASFALAGLTSCRRPIENIVPFVTPPEDTIPGIPVEYRTTMPFGLSAYGLSVKCYDGRPIKIDGNPLHPSTMGKSNAFLQAQILGLYDPDRSKKVLEKGDEKNWSDFVAFWQEIFSQYRQNDGSGLAVISESFASPSLARLKDLFQKTFPRAQWIVRDPVSDKNIIDGLRLVSDKFIRPTYHFDKAEVILSLDCDFLFMENENIRNAYQFSKARNVLSRDDTMNRLYVVEGTMSVTGAHADHRFRCHSNNIPSFLSALYNHIQNNSGENSTYQITEEKNSNFDPNVLTQLSKDLLKHKGTSIICAGQSQPPLVHALVALINQKLNNVNSTVTFHQLDNPHFSDSDQINGFVQALENKKIETVISLGSNPVFNFNMHQIVNIKNKIHFGLYVDETAKVADWHIPQSHFLESWGDATSNDGTQSVIQPLIHPLYESKSPVEFFMLLASGQDSRGYDIVRDTWRSILPNNNFEKNWHTVLHDGLVENQKSMFIKFRETKLHDILQDIESLSYQIFSENNLEIVYKPSSHVYDGRFANIGWLAENPDPITKLTWDNAALISPYTAQKFSLKNNDIITISVKKHILDIPVWIVPGQADFSITLPLGFGQTSIGRVGNNVGFNIYPLRSDFYSYCESDAQIHKTGKKYELVSTQGYGTMGKRPLVHHATLQEYNNSLHIIQEKGDHSPSKNLWKEHKYDKGFQWAMVIDLNKCIGCGACTVACQSENNIPIVGKAQVANGREMHWMRIDRYFDGQGARLRILFQPIACMHCENAPCEQVCPVAATVHDSEGLNLMAYNRCIGTRYCSNNCPYKVRRFNFFNYYKKIKEIEKLGKNPNVTVRSRGVMEKCTYCLQRINEMKKVAKKQGRKIKDGEIKTACQQACPSNAIIFGNLNDPESEVSKYKNSDREYVLLGELNNRPRTTFLAKLCNTNSAMEDRSSETI